MTDSGAAILDEQPRPPRQGDSDKGRALLLGAPTCGRWPLLLAPGEAIFGRLDWWPRPAPDVGGVLVSALARAMHESSE